MSYPKEPIKGMPNGIDDDTINRGITGQCLREKSQDYDPATGKRTGGKDVNLVHNPYMGGEKPSGY